MRIEDAREIYAAMMTADAADAILAKIRYGKSVALSSDGVTINLDRYKEETIKFLEKVKKEKIEFIWSL